MNRPDHLISIAQHLATETELFFEIKGPGAGDRATHIFMKGLRVRATEAFGRDYAEQKLCAEGTNFAVDFFFPEERTIVEVAFSLRNSMSEFEKDILKAVMAQEEGHSVERLVFISKPGASSRHASPGSRAIITWAAKKHGIRVEIHELRPA
jgi:hypothetical protein